MDYCMNQQTLFCFIINLKINSVIYIENIYLQKKLRINK